MLKRLGFAALIPALGLLIGCRETTSSGRVGPADPIAWPPLPKSGFIQGRAATKEDVAAGIAVFSAEALGKGIGVPLEIDIPQYAEWNDKGRVKRVIVIQAEKSGEWSVVGLKEIETGAYVVNNHLKRAPL